MRRREEMEQFDNLLATLEAHGAATPQGWQVLREELAELAGFASPRQMYPFLKKAKEHGLVLVRPQSTGSGSSLRRQADRYFLKVTAAGWAEMRDRVVADVKAKTSELASRKARLAAMERSRLVKQAKRRAAGGGGGRAAPAPARAQPVPVDVEAVAQLVEAMGDDEDLTGW